VSFQEPFDLHSTHSQGVHEEVLLVVCVYDFFDFFDYSMFEHAMATVAFTYSTQKEYKKTHEARTNAIFAI
jgi:uncharacterized protein YabE (DUF348 family)